MFPLPSEECEFRVKVIYHPITLARQDYLTTQFNQFEGSGFGSKSYADEESNQKREICYNQTSSRTISAPDTREAITRCRQAGRQAGSMQITYNTKL